MDSFSLRDVMMFGAVGLLFFGGWNAFIQNKLGSLARLWREYNDHIKAYNADRLKDSREYARGSCLDDFEYRYNENRVKDAREYASRDDLKAVESRIEADLADIKAEQKAQSVTLNKILQK